MLLIIMCYMHVIINNVYLFVVFSLFICVRVPVVLILFYNVPAFAFMSVGQAPRALLTKYGQVEATPCGSLSK
jgi:hypothetical protein